MGVVEAAGGVVTTPVVQTAGYDPRMQDCNILLTGATGSLGSRILDRLVSHSAAVTCIARSSALGLPVTQIWEADFEDSEALARVCDSIRTGPVFDSVVFCAGVDSRTGLAGLVQDPLDRALQVNVLAHADIARAAMERRAATKRRCAYRDIVISSMLVEAPAPHSFVYALTKRGLEQIAHSMVADWPELPTHCLILRLGPLGWPMHELAEVDSIELQQRSSIRPPGIADQAVDAIEEYLLNPRGSLDRGASVLRIPDQQLAPEPRGD